MTSECNNRLIIRRTKQSLWDSLIDSRQSTVYIIEDDLDGRESLQILTESAGHETFAFASAETFLNALTSAHAGCVITDLRLPGMSGLQLQAKLQDLGHLFGVVVITGFGDVPAAVSAMKQGAVDFVEKPYPPALLLERVDAALTLSYQAEQQAQQQQTVLRALAQLTPREREVIDGVAGGKANKVLAADLGISERTVEIHRSNGMKKLHVRSAASLVRLLESAEKSSE